MHLPASNKRTKNTCARFHWSRHAFTAFLFSFVFLRYIFPYGSANFVCLITGCFGYAPYREREREIEIVLQIKVIHFSEVTQHAPHSLFLRPFLTNDFLLFFFLNAIGQLALPARKKLLL